jgi:hypothetical protein
MEVLSTKRPTRFIEQVLRMDWGIGKPPPLHGTASQLFQHPVLFF